MVSSTDNVLATALIHESKVPFPQVSLVMGPLKALVDCVGKSFSELNSLVIFKTLFFFRLLTSNLESPPRISKHSIYNPYIVYLVVPYRIVLIFVQFPLEIRYMSQLKVNPSLSLFQNVKFNSQYLIVCLFSICCLRSSK